MKNLTQQAQTRLRARVARVQTTGDAQACFERILKKYRTVGGAMSIVSNGRILRTLTYGVARRKTKTPVTKETAFRCASVSKTVIAMAAMHLCEGGTVTLDGDIGEVLGYAVRSPYFPEVPITLRHLLTHTAGLTDTPRYDAARDTLRDLLQDAASYRPSKPGTTFHYANLGTGTAGCVMEAASGKRLEEIVRQAIFAPLGIRASFAPQDVTPWERIANGYAVRAFLPPRLAYDAQRIASAPLAPFDVERDYYIAPGRMVCTSEELAQLLLLLLSKDSKGILSPESLKEIRTLQDGRGSVIHAGRGLNVAFIDDVFVPGRLIGHQGNAYGMCCELWGDVATQSGVVLQINGARLSREDSMMHVGAQALALGFALLKREG